MIEFDDDEVSQLCLSVRLSVCLSVWYYSQNKLRFHLRNWPKKGQSVCAVKGHAVIMMHEGRVWERGYGLL